MTPFDRGLAVGWVACVTFIATYAAMKPSLQVWQGWDWQTTFERLAIPVIASMASAAVSAWVSRRW